MGTDETGADEGKESYGKLLGKCLVVGGVLGVVGVAVFLGIVLATGWVWAPIGLIPPVLAGLAVGSIAGERGGFVTALVAVVAGMGPLAVLYLVLVGAGLYSFGRVDVAIVMFGLYFSLKLGTGSDEDEADETAGAAAAEDGPAGERDLDDLTEAEAAEVMASDDPVAALADALDDESAPAADGAGGEAAEADSGGGGEDDGESTASDFVETGFDEDDF